MHRFIRPSEKGNRTTSSVLRTEHGHLAGLGCGASPSCSMRAEDFPKVVVIGAGMAGLSATRELRRKGWPQDKVVLLEASGNIGGRMRTRLHRSGAMCDLGAAYIHGTTGNPLTALASEAGIDLKQVSESNPWIENSASLALYSGGKRVTAPEVAETDDAFYELVQRVTTRVQSCEDSFFRASDGIDEILEEEPFCSLSPAGLSRLRFRLLALSLWHGCDLKDMQLRSLDFGMLGDKPLRGGQGIYGDFPGPHCMVEGGMERIVQAVANPEVRECLRLNATVTHVSFVSGDTTSPIGGEISGREEEPEGGVRESVENEAAAVDSDGGGCVRVDFAVVGEEERRESVWTDAVIVAVPLSLLQQGAVEFDPPIPEKTRSVMSRLKMGNYEKIIMEFEQPFWPADVAFIGCCPQPPSGRNLQPVPHATGLAASSVTAPVLLENYLYSKGVPVLTASFTGELGRMVVSSKGDRLEENNGTKDAQARDMYIRLVKPALEDAFGNGEELPDPVSVETTSWAVDPLQKGSYSFFPVGARDDDIHYAGAGATMGVPGAEPGASEAERVFFAGEATFSGYEGSMHGAYLSGVRAADDITHAFDLPI